jgi:hypothetical protein
MSLFNQRYQKIISRPFKSVHFYVLSGISALTICILIFAFQKKENQNNQIVTNWYDYFLVLEKFTEGFRPPVAARTYGILGIIGYETALKNYPDQLSFSGKYLNLPETEFPQNIHFNVNIALNAAYAEAGKLLFLNARKDYMLELQKKEEMLFQEFKTTNPLSDSVSAAYGKQIARKLISWSAQDSIAHIAQFRAYNGEFKNVAAPGIWNEMSHPPLLPEWGKSQTILPSNNQYESPAPLAYSVDRSSLYSRQFLEVYSVRRELNQENRWIGEFWSDDLQGLTFSAASRWISIANQALIDENLPLDITLETMLKTGLALYDTGVICWRMKYKYLVLRPSHYINENIDPNWNPVVDNPHFPAYPSGHSAFGGAAATVLESMLGHQFEMYDRSHIGRKEFKGKPRHFNSFREMANENAFSRILMGLHTRMDCDEGLRMGNSIGNQVNQIELKKQPYLGIL